jgi:hypothetical protein
MASEFVNCWLEEEQLVVSALRSNPVGVIIPAKDLKKFIAKAKNPEKKSH